MGLKPQQYIVGFHDTDLVLKSQRVNLVMQGSPEGPVLTCATHLCGVIQAEHKVQ